MDPYFERCINGPPFHFNEDKQYEFRRLLSFEKWPNSASVFPVKLAKAGFYYTGKSDEVICFKCGLRKGGWKEGDVPLTVHRQLNPTCDFLGDNCVENVPFPLSSEEERLRILQQLSDHHIDNPEDLITLTSSVGGNDSTVEVTSNNIELDQDEDYGNAFAQRNPEAIKNNVPDSCPVSTDLEQSKTRSDKQVAVTSTGVKLPEPTSSTTSTTAKISVPIATSRPGEFSGALTSAGSTAAAAVGGSSVKPGDKSPPNKSARSTSSTTSTSSSGSAHSKSTKSSTSKMISGNEDIAPSMGESLGPLRYERNRLETFKDWPSAAQVRPADLANCGFYYTGSADRCKCIFCKGILRNWEEGDRPHIEHRKHFPRCPLVLGLNVGNVPLPIEQQASQRSQKVVQPLNVYDSIANMEALGINTDRPKNPQYAIETQRLSSFRNWPTYKHQTPKQLAEAGFFYAGFGDNVKCFFCNGGLRNWDPGDDPWQEHAKWFPECPYVKQNKGDDFVSSVAVEAGTDVPILQQTAPQVPNVAHSEPGEAGRAVEEREVRARMDSAHVKAVLAMGLSTELIMDTLRKQLQGTGDDFPSAAALLEGIFRMQDEIARKVASLAAMAGSSGETEVSMDDRTTPQEPAVCSDVTPADVDVTPAPLDVGVTPAPLDEGSGNDLTRSSSDKDLKEAAGQMKNSSSMPEATKLLQENLELKEQRLCKICMAADAAVVFLPCGHLVSCAACAPALVHCPICRSDIRGTVRTYMS